MSWLFSQALVEEYLGDTCLDGELSAPLSGNNTQQAYLSHGKTMGFSRLSRFGMIVKLLTDTRGQELLMLYLAAFPAKTFQPQAMGEELKVQNPQCGNTWQGSLARLDLDTLLWKTAQCSLLEDLELSLQTFPRWGLMQNGALYPQQTLVQTISVKESGLEPNNETFFHTPNTTGMDGGSNSRKALKKRLEWPTPIANDAKKGQFCNPMTQQNGLSGAVQRWPTPMSTEHKANRQTRENHQNGLTQAVLATETGGQLNQTWVEWLMGWPLGWTDLKPLEMDKCLYVQQLHGSYLNE
jgi:DNA (cytosine-5)-methyltransferase 1